MLDHAVRQETRDTVDELDAIASGFRRAEKTISPKYFYDDRGSQLFDSITEQPEYYPTQTELLIMRDNVADIADRVGPQASLIEFGSGSSLKTHILLNALESLAAYVPVDISEEHLLASANDIQKQYPHIEVLPVVADFTRPFDLPAPKTLPRRNIVYFPGSTIGNFATDDALELLRVMYGEAGTDGALLIGVDLQKDAAILESAYNDAAGVTAEFNRNMLSHLNSAFGTDFDVDCFTHRASYNAEVGRIEMRLIAEGEQTVHIGKERFVIEDGESILTEYSHKYTLDGFASLAGKAGFTVDKVWTDAERLFSVQYLVRD